MHDRTTSTELIYKYINVSAYIIRIYLNVRKLANKTDKSSIRLEKPMDIKLLSIFQFNHTNTNMFTKLNIHLRPPPPPSHVALCIFRAFGCREEGGRGRER